MFKAFVEGIPREPTPSVDFLVALNQRVQKAIGYVIRLEPGVQTPGETLIKATGSCRDSAWLLVQVLRHLGLAARFVSGYLIQLTPDVKSLDGPSGTDKDFTDLVITSYSIHYTKLYDATCMAHLRLLHCR